MPIDTLPGYLRAISILEPKGDAAAEIIAEVRELRRRSRRSWLSGLAAPAVISFLVLALGTTFFVKNYWQLRSRMTAMLRGSASTRSSAFTVEPRAEHLFKDHAEGWGVSPEGILHTEDGTVWDWQTRFKGLNFIVCIDRLSVWAIGYAGSILHTPDGGRTWQRQASGEDQQNLYSASFVNAKVGWAVGSYGAILHTDDGGDTWTHQWSGTTANLTSVSFSGPQSGWAVGVDGIIRHTSNAGRTWELQNSMVKVWLSSVMFIDHETGWAVGEKGAILKTVDSGRHWASQHFGEHTLLSVFFIDNRTGWIAGEGTVLHTEDGGKIWRALQVEGPGAYSSVVFATSRLGWIYGAIGCVLRTDDGGLQWYRVKIAERPQPQNGPAAKPISITFVPRNPGVQ